MAKKRAAAEAESPARKTTTKSAGKASPVKAAKKKAPAATKTADAKTAAAPKKKAPPVKLNDKQKQLMILVRDAGEAGLSPGKDEKRGVAGLRTRKLVKRSVDKETKAERFQLTKLGEKALAAAMAKADG